MIIKNIYTSILCKWTYDGHNLPFRADASIGASAKLSSSSCSNVVWSCKGGCSSTLSIACSSGMTGGAGVKRRLATLILPSFSSPVAAGVAGLEPSELRVQINYCD